MNAADSAREMILSGVPEGLDALVLAQLARESGTEASPGIILHVARDDRRLDALVPLYRAVPPLSPPPLRPLVR